MSYKILVVVILLVFWGCHSTPLEPANGSISIPYYVPEKGHVKLILLNNYNSVVSTLVDEDKDAGLYSINFAYSDYTLNEGVYYLKFYYKYVLQSTQPFILVNP